MGRTSGNAAIRLFTDVGPEMSVNADLLKIEEISLRGLHITLSNSLEQQEASPVPKKLSVKNRLVQG
jgi:hypothetical protein